MTPSILISGASVAGPALAAWLVRDGWDVTVVERAAELRSAGQNVDVRGAGRTVAQRLGVEDAIRAATTTEEGTQFVDADGAVVSSFDATGDDAPTAELEILRGQLSRILHDSADGRAAYVFGDHITAIDDRHVTFASGRERDFDVIAVAEGQRSGTRGLVFDDVELRHLGVDTAYLTIPRTADDTRMWRNFIAGGRRVVSLRPDDVGTTRATLAFQTEPQGYDELDRSAQVSILRERFAGAGWETDRILAALDDADLYYESLAQVVSPTWSRGRVVLLGDAAHCVTPLAGFGTSLALAGAYLLAGELTSTGDHGVAFERYEARLRPFAEDKQDLPPGVPGIAYPDSEWGARLLGFGTKVAASRVGQALVSLAPSGQDDLELPVYPALSASG